MSFWQENYQFIKEVYDMRHMKMAEWMENVEKVGLSFSMSSVTLSATICIIFFRPLLASWLIKSTHLLSSKERGTTSRLV